MLNQTEGDKFFNNLKEWSERKLVLLQKYLDGAVKIMQIMGPVYYVDCFAGRGTYGKPDEPQLPGSPVRAAQLAQQYLDQGRSYHLNCINIEADVKRFQALQAATAPYKAIVQNLQGTFAQHINTIVGTLAQRPAVCFLDPFGVDGMDWKALQKLIRRPAATDLWIRFDVDEVRRRDGYYDNPQIGAEKQFDILMRVYGIEDKNHLHALLQASTAVERKQVALNLYLQRLREEFKTHKREGYAEAYRIGSIDEETQYYLVFASASKKGIILASNVVHDVEEDYKRDIERYKATHALQTSMFGMIDPPPEDIFDDKVEKLVDAMWLKGRGRVISRRDLHSELLSQWFGIIKASHVTQAIKRLIATGYIVSLDGTPGDEKAILHFKV